MAGSTTISRRVSTSLLLGAHSNVAEALNRLARAEVFQLEELTDFNLPIRPLAGGIGEAIGPFHRLFLRFHLNERVAGNELLGFGKRPIDDSTLSSRVLDARPLRAWLEARGIEQDTGLDELFMV